MKILKYAFHITPARRRVIAALAVVIVLTSTHVQAAQASSDLPSAPTPSIAAMADQGQDAVSQVGLVVPDNIPDPASPATSTAPAVTSTSEVKPTKQVWNTINAPDLVTKADYSSESAVRTMTVAATSYTSDPKECDSTPFTTADGTRVHDGIIAANFLKFGTRVRLPDQFGDKVFVVHDRMNVRYNQRIDIWVTNKSTAFAWGLRNVRIEILP